MSLWFDLRLGYDNLGTVTMQRMEGGLEVDDPDSVNRYQVELTRTTERGRLRCVVEHRYGDGAWVLVRKALQALEAAEKDDDD